MDEISGLRVYEPRAIDAEQWVATHEPTDTFVADCLDLSEPPRFLGMSKRRERVVVRAGLFFREYEWREWEEPDHYYPWYLFETWRLPDGRKYARKTEITEHLAHVLIDQQGVRRGPNR